MASERSESEKAELYANLIARQAEGFEALRAIVDDLLLSNKFPISTIQMTLLVAGSKRALQTGRRNVFDQHWSLTLMVPAKLRFHQLPVNRDFVQVRFCRWTGRPNLMKLRITAGSFLPAIIRDMPRILSEITHAYSALAAALSSLPADEASDTRFMSELASHAVDLFEAGQAEDARPAFDLAEHFIAFGDEEESHAAVVGFLETVQNVASHRKCGAAAFEHFLGPKSQVAWGELITVWQGKMTLAEVVASETGATLKPRWWQFWRKRDRRIPSELLNEVQDPELRKIIEQITRE